MPMPVLVHHASSSVAILITVMIITMIIMMIALIIKINFNGNSQMLMAVLNA